MPGLDRDRCGLAAASIGHFQVVAPDQAIVSFGVAEAFEGEVGFCHLVTDGRSPRSAYTKPHSIRYRMGLCVCG